jgi:hypothetical protein
MPIDARKLTLLRSTMTPRWDPAMAELKIDYSSTCDIKPSFQNHLDHARSDRLHLHLHFRLPLPAC